MTECIDAIHLTVEAARRVGMPGTVFAETMSVCDGAFRAAEVMASDPVGALRVILESCRSLTGVLSESLAAGP